MNAICTHPWAVTEIGVNSNRPYCQGCGLDWQAVLHIESDQSAEAEADERRHLENAAMAEHFRRHPHG